MRPFSCEVTAWRIYKGPIHAGELQLSVIYFPLLADFYAANLNYGAQIALEY